MKKVLGCVIVILLLSVSGVFADDYSSTLSQTYLPSNYQNMKSLLNVKNLDIHHQFQYTFSSGFNNSSQMTGLYMSTMKFQLSNPLEVQVHLGYKYQPLAYKHFSEDNGELSGLTVNYKLSETQQFGLEYGLSSRNQYMYNYFDHQTKPLNVWYQGSFLDNSLQFSVQFSNYPSNSLFQKPWYLE